MIAIVITRAVPDHLRGYIGRFLTEIVPGVFVGRTSSTVADRIWERTATAVADGATAIVITDPSTEQGYRFRTAGTNPPQVTELDGLQLIARQIVTETGNKNENLEESK
ncbi:type I-E CRISPR-associated endoribonuclease Cas2e [Arthrobacter oryzae]|uniref:Type I-E CRISPR-associated endoribonuclease Cas2 n=1 Tax=Arthrobacter oryzae TaxID=409290 RepID=A0A3N0C7R1_9MICC|nr:type I-E CRISPR-associated endoribonuclease Cas2e [Arthrobacter oryzae]RNL59205.1 type I-E CRISPR-associated endoribonuclease Cas2 [Arthrobacter oryzae]